MMLWSEVKENYPSQWVLIEAIDAKSDGKHRIVEEVGVVNAFQDDSIEAMRQYIRLHRANKSRELYVVHTSRDQLNIEEQTWVGVRGMQ